MFRLPFFCILVAALLVSLAPAATVTRPPNIIFIIADDLGYGDLGSYGQKLIHTPRTDRMAKEGLRFTQFYASASCAPARCVLLTGLHSGHARIRSNAKSSLRPEDTTFVELLQRAGYATGGVGKWGQGDRGTTGAPWKKGFDLFFGYLDQTQAHTHYPDHLWRNDTRVEIPENRDKQRRVYSHDLFTTTALDFIRQHKDQPFFLYGAYTLPHAEVAVPDDSLAEYRGKWPEPVAFPGSATYCAQDQPRAVRAAMISRLDRDVGRILDLVEELKLTDNTLVIFTSDNGPITAGGQDPEFFASAGPLRGLKFTLYEGGIRVPFIARWPGCIVAGTESPLVAGFDDLFPTLVELARGKTPAGLDGVSLAPTLLGQPEKQVRRELLYWEAAPQQAARAGDWKAYRPAPNQPLELYNLANDIGETKDLAAARPEITARMTKLLESAHVDSPEFPLHRKGKKKR